MAPPKKQRRRATKAPEAGERLPPEPLGEPPPEAERPAEAEPPPHDQLFKYVFSRPEHAAAELRHLLPPAVAAAIDWSQLSLVPGETISERLGERRCDLLFRAPLAGRPAYLLLLFEHQRKADRAMPLRLLRYQVALWTDHDRQHPGEPLPAVVPCVLHHGRRPWRAPTRLSALFDLGDDPAVAEALRPHLPDFTFLIEDLPKVSDQGLLDRALAALPTVTLLLLKHARSKVDLGPRLRTWHELFAAIARDVGDRDAWIALARYVLRASDTPVATIAGTVGVDRDPVEKEHLMTTAQRLFDEGRVEGRVEANRAVLPRLLRLRFGAAISADLKTRIEAADADCLDVWIERVDTAASLAAVFAD